MEQEKKHLRKSIVLTLVLYGAVAVLLGVSLHLRTPSVTVATSQPVSIVKAVTVNQSQVQAEMNKIQEQRQEQQRKEQAHQEYLKHLAQQARQQRVREQKQLAALRAQQMQLAKQQKIEAFKAHQRLVALQKQQQAEQQKLAAMHAQAAKQKAAAKAKTLAKQKQLAAAQAKALAQKKEQLAAEKALQQQINSEQSRLNAARNQELMSEMAKYKALILNAIGQQWIMPRNTDRNLSTELSIRLAPGGTVLNVSLLRSSGNAVLDRSVITAVRKASPLPVPTDPTVFNQFRELHLVVKPEGLLG